MINVTIYLKKIQSKNLSRQEQSEALGTCGRELLCHGLQTLYGLTPPFPPLRRTAHGKPYLPTHPEIHFNISHSGDYAACAFSSIPIGLDIQQSRPVNYQLLAQRYFSQTARQRLLHSPTPIDTFYEIWTEQESYTKWLASSLSQTLNTTPTQGTCTHFTPAPHYHGALWTSHPATLTLTILP